MAGKRVICFLSLVGFVCAIKARKNVLFIVSDDLRPQLASYYGPNFPGVVHQDMHTPNTNALAARSLLLTRAYVQQSVCSPSRSSFLTGRRPDTTHVYDLNTYFRKVGGNYTTIPQYFKQNGYMSVGMGKIFHPAYAASRRDDPISWSVPYFHGNVTFESRDRSWEAIPDKLLVDNPLRDQQLAIHAIKTLRQVAPAALSGETPFFMAVGFQKPHQPFVFPESSMRYYPESSIRLPENPYAPLDMPKLAWNGFGGLRNDFKDLAVLNATGKINTTFPDETVLQLRRAYYSAVTFVDSLVGDLISELDRLGLSDNTIISFIGDHGWHLGEHGEWCKETNFEQATHAPMMISIPGVTDNGIRTNQLAEFVDLFPTLVDAAELPPLPLCPRDSTKVELCREGTSLLPLINNPNVPVKYAAFSQLPRKLGRRSIMGYTIRTDRYRYTEWVLFHDTTFKPNWNKQHGVELYDHKIDPEENYNRASRRSYKIVAGWLQQCLHNGWRHALPYSVRYNGLRDAMRHKHGLRYNHNGLRDAMRRKHGLRYNNNGLRDAMRHKHGLRYKH